MRLTPPKTPQQQAAHKIDACPHTDLKRPECCCPTCIQEMIARYMPEQTRNTESS